MSTARDYAVTELADVRRRIDQLKTSLDSLPAGVRSVTIDGTTTTMDRMAIENELQFLERKAAVLAGKRQRVASIRLDNSF